MIKITVDEVTRTATVEVRGERWELSGVDVWFRQPLPAVDLRTLQHGGEHWECYKGSVVKDPGVTIEVRGRRS